MVRRLLLLVVAALVAGVAVAAPAFATAPTATAVSPTSGAVDTTFTVTGTGFTSSAQVSVGGVAARGVKVGSSTRLTARVPVTGTGPVVVKTSGGKATGPTFTVTAGVLLSPAVVRPGESTAVGATGFGAGEAVDVYLDATDTALVVAGADGTVTTTVAAPRAATPGAHWVTVVGRRSGTAAQDLLTVRTDWSAPGFDARHTGVNPFETAVTAASVDDLAERWSTYFGAPATSAPVVAGGLVFLHTDNDDVAAVDAMTGVQKWRVDLSTASTGYAPLVAAAGVVYAGTSDGYLYALDALTGARKWRYATGGSVWNAPVVAGDTVYVPSRAGTLHAVDVATGAARWVRTIPGGTGTFPLDLTVVGGWIYVGAVDNTMRRIDAVTGGTGWVVDVGGSPYSAPVVADGKVFVPTLAGMVLALRAATGATSWSATVGTGSVVGTPALVGGRLIVGNTQGVVTAYEYTTGAVLWTRSDGAGYSQVTSAGGVAYVADSGLTHAYDVRTGSVLRTLAIGANTAGLVISDGALIGYDYTERTLVRYDLGRGTDVVRPSPARLLPDRSLVAR